MNYQKVRSFVETVYRAYFNTVSVLTKYTIITYYECHAISKPLILVILANLSNCANMVHRWAWSPLSRLLAGNGAASRRAFYQLFSAVFHCAGGFIA
jgi:hypothetical protein